MKILHTLRSLSRNDGGPVSSAYQLAKGLQGCGVETNILAIASRDTDLDLPPDPEIIRYVDHDVITPFYYSRNFARFLREHIADYDLVHTNSLWQWPSHCAATICHAHDIPNVVTPHGVLMPQAMKKSWWKKRMAMMMYQRIDLRHTSLIHVTSQIELEAIRLLGFTNPTAVIPNCVPLPPESMMRSKANPRRTFVFVGRFDPHKNIDKLLKAWSALGNFTTDCRLYIVGEGPRMYTAKLRRIVERDVLRNVRFLPFQSGAALTKLMAAADYLVLPSKSENFGMVAAEALAVGVPVIATQNSPWKLLDRERCGISHQPQLAPLIEALRRAILIPEDERRQMGLRGREVVKRLFVPERVATDMRAAYEWTINGGSKPDFIHS